MVRLIRRVFLAWLVIVNLIIPLPTQHTHAQSAFDPENTRRATVQILQVFTNPVGATVITCVGSGTLVSTDGLILTNAHVVLPIGGCRSERLIIALTIRLDEAPVPTYYAEVVNYNIGWDLAVLRITDTIDDLPVNRAALALPFVELGDSEAVRLDSTLEFVGYAAPEREATAEAVSSIVRGTVSGFTAEARVGNRAWIKTRAAIPGGMTGGGAYDITTGHLIGIPTVEPVSSGGAEGEQPTCRRIQDSNGDGRVDTNDVCIPVSGFINAMRPARLARGLILAARLGITPDFQQPLTLGGQREGDPTFARLFFASGVDLGGMPTTIVQAVPTGISSLYLFFDYANMTDGMIYEMRVLRDGLADPTFSLAPATWSGGGTGLWYIGSTAQVYPNGEYEFLLFIEGVRVASAAISVGGVAEARPEFSNIVFGVLSLENQLVSAGNVLPVSPTINAEFAYNNLRDGLTWRQVWYFDGLEIANGVGTWTGGANGKLAVNASGTPEIPLQAGRYRLELSIEERLAATADFIMAGAQIAYNTEIFTNLTFATELNGRGEPSGVVGTTLPDTVQQMYALFDWRDVAVGTPFTWRWTVDNNPLFEVTQPWQESLIGSQGWVRLTAPARLPSGSYKLELLLAGEVKGAVTARVGLGQLPVEIFRVAEGATLRGTILDAETKAGIFGATIIILKVEVDVRDFTWQMSEVYGIAFTDSEGNFAMTTPLVREEIYSIIVTAGGYLPMASDGLAVPQDPNTPFELRLEMNRD